MHEFNMKLLLLTVVWNEYDGGYVKSDGGILEYFFVLWLTYTTAGGATFPNWLDLLPYTHFISC